MRKELAAILAMAAMLVVSQLAALALAPIFSANNLQAFPDTSNPVNPIIYILLILGFTAIILLLFRYRKRNVAKYLVLGSIFITIFFVFTIPIYLGLLPAPIDDMLRSNLALALSFLLAVLMVYTLYRYPEWYVVDTVGISIAAGVTAILGISFAILPAFLLLIGLALYDAWAVYRSKHMVTLADEMTGQRLPVLLVVPKKASYSYMEQGSLKQAIAKGEEREAMFMGLGDIIIPGALAVSALTFPPMAGSALGPDIRTLLGLPSNLLIAIGTMIGTIVGFAVLMRFVMKGNPQAGLPLLNGGAILGYLVSFALVYGMAYNFGLF
ncbi:MAG TPA: presenilin family intramembrane aspartyl protease PSH [Thermoplasmata archaeon]